jgi:LEA14-like dessication related protein
MSLDLRTVGPLVALGVAACGPFSQYGFQRPTVELAAIDITGLGLQGGMLDLLLDVHNPNSYELRTTRVAAGIYLEGTHFGDAALTRASVLPAGETARIVVPVTFSWSGMGSGASGLLARGGVRYRLDGRLDLDTPAGRRGVDVSTEGTVTLRNLVGR